jgi:hypothetical protein
MRGWAKDVDFKNKFVFKDPTQYELEDKKSKSRKQRFTLARTASQNTYKERARAGTDATPPEAGGIKRVRRQTLSARKAEEVMSVMAMTSTRPKSPHSASSKLDISRARADQHDENEEQIMRTPKQQALFDKVVEEAIQTEKDYVRDLGLIFEVKSRCYSSTNCTPILGCVKLLTLNTILFVCIVHV